MKNSTVPVIVIGLLMGMVLFSGIGGCAAVIVVGDTGNDRVKIHFYINGTYWGEFGHSGTGDYGFDTIRSVKMDNDYIYVIDGGATNRLKKYYKNNLTHCLTSPTAFYASDMVLNGNYIYMAYFGLKKYNKDDLTLDSSSVSGSSGRVGYSDQSGYYWIASGGNVYEYDSSLNLIATRAISTGYRDKNDFYYHIGDSKPLSLNTRTIGQTAPIRQYTLTHPYYLDALTWGSGNDQLMEPQEIIDASSLHNHLIIDEGNCKVLEIDNTRNYVRSFGSCGTGDNNFNAPMTLDHGYIVLDLSPSCTDCEWNQTSYTTNTTYQFNFTIQNPEPASYTYRFWIYSSEQSALLNSTLITDPNTITNITGTINPCWTPQPGLSGQIACYFINGTFKEVLDSNTTDISPVGYDYPITDDLSFNETTYDVTTANQTYNLTYNISNSQVSCFKYEIHLMTCIDASCSGGGLSIRNTTLNASNTSIKGEFLTTDEEGYYRSGIIIFDNYNNVMSNHESDTIHLTSGNKPDYYLHYDKRHYNISEGVVLGYASITPYNSSIELWWSGRTVFDANYALYETLTFSGNIYRVFDKPGRYPAWMNLDGWNTVAFDECYVHEATNGVYIAEDVYHYPGHFCIDIIVSSPSHDDLYAVVYNPSDIMIATIHIESSDYVYGISNKTYLIQPTDLSGFYTVGLRTTPTDTNIDSDTCYCQIGDLMTAEIWFVPDEISQGDMMNLWYYSAWGENWTLYLTDPLGIAIGDSLFVDHTDPSTPNFGKLSYQTSPTINTGVYWGKAYNESGSSETPIRTTCNISAGVYDPDAPLLTGVDAFLNVVDVAGFGSTTGKLVIAVLIILVVGYMLGKALDAKSQIILISVLIIGFVAIGFIPVWVLVIVALIVGAVITFNLNNG